MFNRIAVISALMVGTFFCAVAWDMRQVIRVSAEKQERIVEEAQIMSVSWQHCVTGQAKPLTITAEGSDVATFEANLLYLQNKFPNNCP